MNRSCISGPVCTHWRAVIEVLCAFKAGVQITPTDVEWATYVFSFYLTKLFIYPFRYSKPFSAKITTVWWIGQLFEVGKRKWQSQLPFYCGDEKRKPSGGYTDLNVMKAHEIYVDPPTLSPTWSGFFLWNCLFFLNWSTSHSSPWLRPLLLFLLSLWDQFARATFYLLPHSSNGRHWWLW